MPAVKAPKRAPKTSEPAPTSWMERLQLASHVCAILALGAVFLQMKNDADNRTTEASLSYVQQFNDDPVSAHWQNLEAAWGDYQAELARINSGKGLSRSNIDRLVGFVLAKHDANIPSQPARISIYRVAKFFDHVLICSRKGICDSELIDEYFEASIVQFWTNYQSIVLSIRSAGTREIGSEIEKYVARKKS